MKKIKRIKVQESIDKWNEKNPIQIKKTAQTVGESIGINGRSLSMWNNHHVPKQIQCLSDIAKALDTSFDDLFEFEYIKEEDKVVLKRIRISEAIQKWNKTKRKQSFGTVAVKVNYAEKRIRMWNDGNLPFAIHNFFNFCKTMNVKKPFKILEY